MKEKRLHRNSELSVWCGSNCQLLQESESEPKPLLPTSTKHHPLTVETREMKVSGASPLVQSQKGGGQAF